MKQLFSLRSLLLVLICATGMTGYGQQVIGSFPTIDGGFEAQTTTTTTSSIATGTQISNWSISNTTSTGGAASLVLNSSGGRSGSKYITVNNTGSSAIRIQSPTVSTSTAVVSATAHTVQYYYRTASATAVSGFQRGVSPDGTAQPGTYTLTTMAASSGTWTLVQVSQTSGSSALTPRYGVGILRMSTATAVAVDVDDYVIYAGAADNTAPASPGAVTVNGATTTSLNVSWAPSAGVDGGGYVVVRYAVNPIADNDPNPNGIYAVGNTTTNGTGSLTGTVRYIGTGTSFSDNVGLSPATTYYYKVYTVDKAFNYSGETSGNASTLVANPTTTSLSPSSTTALGGNFTLTVNGTNFFSGSVVTWNGSNRTTTFVSTTQVTAAILAGDIAASGTASVGVTNAGAATPNSNTQTFTINGGASQTITFGALPTKTYGDASFNPGATASSSLAVYYASSNTSVATISGGNTINIVGPGTSTITAKQDGDGTYGSAPDVQQTLTVDPKQLTVSGAVAQNKLYDGGTVAIITGYSIVETLVGADVVTVSGGGTFASAAVGTGIAVTPALTLGGAQAAKYTLTQPTGLTADIIAPILAWDFNTKAGNEVSVTATTIDASVSTSSITRGGGIAAAALPNGFSSNTYTIGANLATAITNNQYFQFTVNAVPGKQVSLSSLDANFRRSSTGPNTFQWQYSLDGFATAGVAIGSPISYTSSTTTGDAQTQINLSGITALQNVPTVTTVTFRLYAYGATNAGGTFALGLPTTPVNDLAIGGTITNAPTPSIDISDAHPAAGTVDQGKVDHPIGTIYVDISNATAYLTGITVNTAGTYQASDLTNLKFWINGINTLTGATQLGTSQAAVASGGLISVSGLTTTIPSGSNRYIIVTASIAGNAVVGRTIRIATTSFSNIQFASGTKNLTDPVPASNNQTITQLDPTIAISTAHPAAGNVGQNTTNQIIGSIKLDVTVTSATLTGVDVTMGGNFQASDIQANGFKFWINGTNNLTGATQLGTAQAAVSAGNNITVSSLTSNISVGTTRYILVTADIAYNAVAGRTILLGSTAFSNITFVSANTTGTDPAPAGNSQTITAVAPSIAIASNGPTTGTIGAPSINNILYSFSAAATVNSADFTGITLKFAGTYNRLEFATASIKVWYNSTNTFTGATMIGFGYSMVNANTNLVITGLNQMVSIATTGYFWITGDLVSSVVSGHTINTTAPTLASFTFNQGTKSGTPAATSVQTFLPQPTLTEVIIPQYMHGSVNKIPYIYRVKIGNLAPNTTYRYNNTVVVSSDVSTSNGVGTIIYPSTGGAFTQSSTQSLSTVGAYSSFTTDATGNYTGWFISESSSNTRFTAGNTVYMRILLNDGAGGTTVASRVTTTTSALVVTFATSAGANNATGIRGSSSGTPKDIIMLYDNVYGTGRPITAAYIESDGYANATSYPSYYTTSVDGVAGAWGTVIPNTLTNGIRRIEQRSLATGSIVNCPSVTVNGVWPSGVNTVNPIGGSTALVITSSDAPLNTSANTWLGVNSTWQNAANWVCGIPNSNTSDVIIPANSPVMPSLSYSPTTIRNLNLQGATTLNLNGKALTIAGTITGATGNLKGSSTSDLTLGGAAGTISFTSGFRELRNLTLSAGASASLGTALDITSANFGGSVLVGAGATLTTNNNLTLKSSVNGTASVGNSSGLITGNVTVERYIPAGAFRAWRLLSVPVQGSQTFKAAWQEGNTLPTVGTAGLGTLLTNTTGTNGYDVATAGNSLLSFTNGAPGTYSPVSATTLPMATTSGYFVYIRGDRTASPFGGLTTSNATTLRTNGTLYTGTQSAITLPAGQNVMVGNIYASALSFAAMTISGTNSFKVWDPKLAGPGTNNAGAYQTYSTLTGYVPGGGSYVGQGIGSGKIESGQAFILNSTGGGSVQLTEAAKITGSRNVFRPSGTPVQQLKANIYAVSKGESILADGIAIVLNNAFSNEIDNDDALKILNTGENLGIANGTSIVTVEARRPFVAADKVAFSVSNLKQTEYKFEFNPSNIINSTNVTAVLKDNFTGTETLVSLANPTTVNFTVTDNAKSSASDRFTLVFKSSGLTLPELTNDRSISIYPSLITEKTINVQLVNQPAGKYSVRLLNSVGQLVQSQIITKGEGTSNHQISLSAAKTQAGVYQIEVISPDKKRKIEKVVISNN